MSTMTTVCILQGKSPAELVAMPHSTITSKVQPGGVEEGVVGGNVVSNQPTAYSNGDVTASPRSPQRKYKQAVIKKQPVFSTW
jgi:hypothetical protein